MELTKEQIEFLDVVVKGTWVINSDGEVDVDGNVNMSYMNLMEIPVKFGSVSGYFDCSRNNITSLEFSPTSVGYNIDCYNNHLTNYFKTTKEEDFTHWDKLSWVLILEEYPFLINICKKYRKNLKDYLEKFPQTKIYLK